MDEIKKLLYLKFDGIYAADKVTEWLMLDWKKELFIIYAVFIRKLYVNAISTLNAMLILIILFPPLYHGFVLQVYGFIRTNFQYDDDNYEYVDQRSMFLAQRKVTWDTASLATCSGYINDDEGTRKGLRGERNHSFRFCICRFSRFGYQVIRCNILDLVMDAI